MLKILFKEGCKVQDGGKAAESKMEGCRVQDGKAAESKMEGCRVQDGGHLSSPKSSLLVVLVVSLHY